MTRGPLTDRDFRRMQDQDAKRVGVSPVTRVGGTDAAKFSAGGVMVEAVFPSGYVSGTAVDVNLPTVLKANARYAEPMDLPDISAGTAGVMTLVAVDRSHWTQKRISLALCVVAGVDCYPVTYRLRVY
jgi:hypothetical protein